MTRHSAQDATATTAAPGASSSGGASFFSKLRTQAEAAISRVPQLDELQHSIRQTAVSANPRQSQHTVKIQLAVKGAKGVIIDHDAVARETKSYSKNILDLVRLENRATGTDTADLQDVGDRAALLFYKQGELHAEYARKLEEARTSLKEIRNFEASLQQQRDRRAQLENQLGKLRTSTKPDSHSEDRILDIEEELRSLSGAGTPLAAAEIKVNALKREKLKQSFDIQCTAMQELGEKLSIISGYGKALLEGWNTNETTAGHSDYADGERTAAVRTGVENALSGWSAHKAYVPKPDLKVRGAAGDAGSIAPSFHESHQDELSRIPVESDPIATHNAAFDSYYAAPDSPLPATAGGSGTAAGTAAAPPSRQQAPSIHSTHSAGSTGGMPIPGAFGDDTHTSASGANPFADQLNNAPVTNLPPATTTASTSPGMGVHAAAASPIPLESQGPAGPFPTVAETGAPIVGTGGPSSGVLRPPSHPPTSGSAARSKDEEVRDEINQRFEAYSGHGSAGQQGQEQQAPLGGADLDRDFSMRGRREGEQLPAYGIEGADGSRPAPPEKQL